MGVSNSAIQFSANGFEAGATQNTSAVTSTAGQAFFPTATNSVSSLFVFNQDATNGLWIGISTATATTTLISAYKKIGKVNAGESVKFYYDGAYALCVFGKTTNSVDTTFSFSNATKSAASAS